MSTLSKIIEFLTYTAIVFAAIEVYLKINKIWKRKHDKEVAESQSIIGLGLAAFVMIIWSLNFIIKGDYEAIADNFIYLFESIILIIIGSGIFVQGRRTSTKSLWQLIKESIRLEKSEAYDLLKTLSGKQTAEKMVEILRMLASIDDDVDEAERKLIFDFAKDVGIKVVGELKYEFDKNENESEKYRKITNKLREYLEGNNNIKEITAFQELLIKLINADNKITDEEDTAIGEMNALIQELVFKQDVPKYLVIVIPQDSSHIQLIESFLKAQFPDIEPKSKEIEIDGGYGFIFHECRTQALAEMKANEERENLHLMTIVKMIKKSL